MGRNNRNLFLSMVVAVVLVFLFLTPALAFPEGVDTEDVPEGEDHPLVSRFPGSYIRYYEEKNYAEFTLPFGELKEADDENAPQEDKTIEGKVTKIVDFGAFMEVEDGIEGLIHISQL